MKSRVLAAALPAVLTLVLVNGAWARNPHCAGGIQYLTQALADNAKGNKEDYDREILKAVAQLEACASEDPQDFEGIGYLGWAYAQIDSMCPAGKAFQTAIDGLSSKGDKKKLELVQNNQKSFWAQSFNKGIGDITTAQGLWNPYTNDPSSDAEKQQKADAKKSYDAALANFNKALCIMPSDPRTLRNMGSVYAFTGDYVNAESWFAKALTAAPGDTDVASAIKQARTGRAAQLLKDKKYDDAITYYQDLIKSDPKNADLYAGLGDAALEKGKTLEGDAKKPMFVIAGDAYAKASDLGGGVYELIYNAAICHQNAGNSAMAEQEWAAAFKLKSTDCEVLINLSSVQADEKKFPEAIATAQKAVACDPKKKDGYRQLGAIYTKANDNPHARQALMGYLALDKGTPADAATDASGAGGAKIAGQMGKAETIYLWEADGQKYESWFYWTKGKAYHFGGGTMQESTDWSAALAAK